MFREPVRPQLCVHTARKAKIGRTSKCESVLSFTRASNAIHAKVMHRAVAYAKQGRQDPHKTCLSMLRSIGAARVHNQKQEKLFDKTAHLLCMNTRAI